MPVADIHVSTAYIILTCILAEILRQPIRQYMSRGLLQSGILEFVSMLEYCAVCRELGIIAEISGIFALSAYLFMAMVWWANVWDVPACPYVHVENMIAGKTDAFSGLFFIAAEVAGGLAFYRFYMKPLWSTVGLGALHVAHSHDTGCVSGMHVGYLSAALLEGLGVFVCRLNSKFVSDSGMNSIVGGTLVPLVVTGVVVAIADCTGAYLNPAGATAMEYGCAGANVKEHLVAYWGGPIVGSALAYAVWQNPSIRKIFLEEPHVTWKED